jgi:putative hydrolase of the HAD superfamily
MRNYSTLFLDLDETLYPHSNGLWEKIGDRITRFMVTRLDMNEENAQDLRARYLSEYGTTLNGLRANHGVDPDDYLEYVHDVPIHEHIEPAPHLRQMLASIRIKKIIFTNSQDSHVKRVLNALDVSDQIDDIIDIYALNFTNKPRPEAYAQALKIADSPDPKTCILADDRSVNLMPAAELGMTTVLVGANEGDAIITYHIEEITDLVEYIPELADPSRRRVS